MVYDTQSDLYLATERGLVSRDTRTRSRRKQKKGKSPAREGRAGDGGSVDSSARDSMVSPASRPRFFFPEHAVPPVRYPTFDFNSLFPPTSAKRQDYSSPSPTVRT